VSSLPPHSVSGEDIRDNRGLISEQLVNGESAFDSRGGVRSTEQLRQSIEGGSGLESRGGVKSSEQLKQVAIGVPDHRGGVRSGQQLERQDSGDDGKAIGLESRGGGRGSEQYDPVSAEGGPRRVGGTGLVISSTISNDGEC
jgi:hypothetical protein